MKERSLEMKINDEKEIKLHKAKSKINSKIGGSHNQKKSSRILEINEDEDEEDKKMNEEFKNIVISEK